MATDGAPDKTTLRIECVCLLREFGKKPFHLIDAILGLSPGDARKTYQTHNEAYISWTKKFAQESLKRFYSDQVTILQSLSMTTPEAIKIWQDLLFDPASKPTDKERAAKEVREWTKLFLASKDKAGVRDLIPDELLDAHDQAEELGGHLQRLLGRSLDIEEQEPS
ncbi:MAG: hypothetical protein ACYSWO_29230 [Planctomycetota bacterium]|jgi:hypothetical protein